MIGGDEVASVVLDWGSKNLCAGYGGDDEPKLVIPTAVAKTGSSDKLLCGDQAVYRYADNTEIVPAVVNDVIADWEAAAALWQYSIDELRVDIKNSALLMTESIWNSAENRAKSMEFAFETQECPAFYIAKKPVCSTFAAGRGIGLVVDIGADTTAVTPVIDGLCLYKSSRCTVRAGRGVNRFLRAGVLADVDLTPRYRIQRREVLAPGATDVKLALKDGLQDTVSFREFQIERVVEEFKEMCAYVPVDSTDEKVKPHQPMAYEFPSGVNDSYSVPVDWLMDAGSVVHDAAGDEDESARPSLAPVDAGVSAAVIDALKSCDVDVRASLANNILVDGGGSLLYGCTDRLNEDISAAFPGLRTRVYAPGNTYERVYSSWVGGSILSSLGTFHQLWVSKAEYEEDGASKLERRFK